VSLVDDVSAVLVATSDDPDAPVVEANWVGPVMDDIAAIWYASREIIASTVPVLRTSRSGCETDSCASGTSEASGVEVR
jgi:hypothetical protein